jgi:mannose-6-phosphate isomerase-like protein (cupin superfamily)
MYVRNVWQTYHFVSDGQPGVEYYVPIPDDMTLGIDVHGVKVGKPMKEHSHPHIEQVYFITSGRGLMKVGDEEREVEKDMIIYVPAGAVHSIRPIEGDTDLTYLFFSHHHEVCRKPEERL